MRRFLVCVFLPLFAACSPSTDEATEPRDPPRLSYAMSLDTSTETPALVIDMTFPGDSDGSTWLALPNEWGGQSELYNELSAFAALSPDTEILSTDNPSVMEVTAPAGAEVHVRYRLAQDWEGVPEPSGGNPYRVVIQSDYVHLIGWAAWALPQWDDWPGENPEVAFHLDWSRLPGDWEIADNFGVGRDVREAVAPLNRLQSGLFVAGDFRILTRDTGTAQLYVAIRGQWEFGDNTFANLLRDVVDPIRTFWREDGTDPYLVTLLPIHRAEGNDEAISWGGTGLADSFALFATTNVALADFQTLAAHEFQHRWTPSKLGEFADPEEALYWFSEGFTDYYASLLSLRGGLIDLEGYADQVNGALRDYYRSSAREAPVEQVIEWFWSDQDLQRLPYLRGRLVAARWNAEIMAASDGAESLDTVLFDMLAAAETLNAVGETREIRPSDIVEAALHRSASRAEADYQSFIVEGAMVPLEPGMFGPCYDLRDTVFHLWDIGFDTEASFEARVVTGVREGGPAWEAGMRDGMPFGGWSIPDYGNPETDATFYVGVDGEPVSISYKPQGEAVETIPQLTLPEDLSDEDRAACLAWLGVD